MSPAVKPPESLRPRYGRGRRSATFAIVRKRWIIKGFLRSECRVSVILPVLRRIFLLFATIRQNSPLPAHCSLTLRASNGA
jgi:hypothetical protein